MQAIDLLRYSKNKRNSRCLLKEIFLYCVRNKTLEERRSFSRMTSLKNRAP
ncbi:hypothetical protein CpB0822 [Chlamydia pneumoniae TW-183]|uniref:Uncharacterized protein n=1 Tax=Chlamydia pneumoniae TaxID=83558 RepID=A0ABN3YRZ6_CHLPN|nr:hypothetical protein CpB0822 [Chlamydia pneumoniae TW-183]